ncbi:MAG: hypothetical protein WC449_02410 [Candidatus Paceibacterota bacterium]
MVKKKFIIAEVLKNLDSGRFNLLVCTQAFKDKYYDEIDFRREDGPTACVVFNTEEGTVGVVDYNKLMDKKVLVINSEPNPEKREEFSDMAAKVFDIYRPKAFKVLVIDLQ